MAVKVPNPSGYRVRYCPDLGPPELAPDVYQHQACVCGHSRFGHTDYLGSGKDRVLVMDCLHAGTCRYCGCERFVFSTARATPEALANRRREQEMFEVVPPASVVKAREQ